MNDGSPPRAWGLVAENLESPPLKRFTPTGVGTGVLHFQQSIEVAVHPHGRGDWLGKELRNPLLLGSPPRAWGLVLR